MLSEYHFVELEGYKIAYRRQGRGQPVLMVHGFASNSFTWQPLIDNLPNNFCFYTIDMKGFGYSEKICDEHLSPFDQARIITTFINHFSLTELILCGHSMGGAACTIAMFDENLRQRVSQLILVDSAGFFTQMPSIFDLAYPVKEDSLLMHLNEIFFVDMFLKEVYYDSSKIDKTMANRYVEFLKLEGAKECLIVAAKQVAIANVKSFRHKLASINVPTLIIWGENDRIIKVDDAQCFKDGIPNSELRVISHCGHSPQEETPEYMARLFMDFTAPLKQYNNYRQAIPFALEKESKNFLYKLFKRKRFGYWSFSTMSFIIAIKILLLCKRLGLLVKENGWSRASAIYFRNKHVKFCLSCLRLDYLSHSPDENISYEKSARNVLIKRLADYLRQQPGCRWQSTWRRFMPYQKQTRYSDIIEAEFDRKGQLLKLTPHFDCVDNDFPSISESFREEILQEVMESYNRYQKLSDYKRIRLTFKSLKKKLSRSILQSVRLGFEIELFVTRIFNGTYIHFEVMAQKPEINSKMRFKTPKFNRRLHIGDGLLNIQCRFTPGFKEADLWLQYQHASIYGTQMQEMLDQLSQEWGKCGEVLLPAAGSSAARPEFSYFGKNIFRVRTFVNFTELFQLREKINKKYYIEMGGNASIISLIAWGLSCSEAFKSTKFVCPIDILNLNDLNQERLISLLFLQPGLFNSGNRLEDFLRYQRKFNQRLFATRMGTSESHKFLEIMAITHPAVYSYIIKMMPRALDDIVGTLCLSVIRNAEVFVAPVSDRQKHGFAAISSCDMKTEDGSSGGCFSFCGEKQQARDFVRAINAVIPNVEKVILD